MDVITGPTRFTRRRFGKLLAGFFSALTLLNRRQALAGSRCGESATQFIVYRFNPDSVDPVSGASCSGCSACRRHAEHKLFASFAAADTRRAHPHCRCAIQSVVVSKANFLELFGVPDDSEIREEFDVRWLDDLNLPPNLTMGGLEMPADRVR
jgi:hypothetical protein